VDYVKRRLAVELKLLLLDIRNGKETISRLAAFEIWIWRRM